MTVSSETAKSGPYTGNGVTTVFAYGFRILDAGHIEVVRTVSGTNTTVSPSEYTVSGVGDLAGGNVTFAVAPVAGQSITIIRSAPFTQAVDLENQGAYYAETIEEALDIAAMRDQQMAEELARAVKLPVGYDPSELAALTEDLIRVADSADEIDTVAGIEADVVTVAGLTAEIAALPGQLSAAQAAAAAAETALDSFDDRYLGAKAVAPTVDNDGNALLVGAVYWDTVSSQMFTWSGAEWRPTFLTGNAVRQLTTATGGQTVVTVPTYLVGANTIQVYLNGLKVMVGADYTETDQNTITFLSGLTAGDEVEVIVLQPYAIGTTGAESITTEYGVTLARLLELREGTVADLLADTTLNPAVVPVGSVIEAGGFRYQVAASGASDQHVTTAGGVKLYVQPSDAGYNVKAFGAVGDWNGTTGTSDSTAFTAMRSACIANSTAAYIPAGRYRLTQAWTVGTGGVGSYDGFDIRGDGQECTDLVLDYNGSVGVDMNPGTGGYTAFAASSVGGFRITVPTGRAVVTPLYIKNSYNCNYHDIHVYVPLASVTSNFVGVRVSGACYFNTYRNLWVEVYGGDATLGKAYYIGNGRADVGLDGANTSVNTFINCRTRGVGVGFDLIISNSTTLIECDAEVCGTAFRDLGTTGSMYLNCWAEGSSTADLSIDRTTAQNGDGSTFTTSGSDYTIIQGGFWSGISLGYATRTRIMARYSSLTATANTEELDTDVLNTAATHTGAGNDVRITQRKTTPVEHTTVSLGSRRFGYEFPNSGGPGKMLWSNSGDDLLLSAYRTDGGSAYRGWRQGTTGTGGWELASWFTAAGIGSESPQTVMTANVSGVSFAINPFAAVDNAVTNGTSSNRWSVVYAGTGTINTSDEREKQQIQPIDEAALRAWARVEYCQYRFNDAVAEKGDGARWHFGVVAQRVKEAFEAEGLDPFAYGVLCYDEWPATEDRPAGNRYGIRYEEALALECAYLRSRLA